MPFMHALAGGLAAGVLAVPMLLSPRAPIRISSGPVPATVQIRVADVGGSPEEFEAEVLAQRGIGGCSYALRWDDPADPVDRGIAEITSDLGDAPRRSSRRCTGASFIETEASDPLHFDMQTAYYWTKAARDYAVDHLWRTDAEWPFDSVDYADDVLAVGVLSEGAFENACWPDPNTGCMRSWPHEGPRIHLRHGRVTAKLVAHEYGHYAASYVFGYQNHPDPDMLGCMDLGFQEAVANIFEALFLHSRPEARDRVDEWDDERWSGACHPAGRYWTGRPLVQAVEQALWGRDWDSRNVVEWGDADANAVMSDAFAYALATNAAHSLDVLANRMLERIAEQADPAVSARVEAIFARHGHGVFEVGAVCATNDNCLSGRCHGSTGRCIPVDGTGELWDYCTHDNHCINRNCISPAGGGQCRPQVGIGAYCEDNNACAGGRRCDRGPFTHGTRRCIPNNGEGQVGDYCSDVDHCANQNCVSPEGGGECRAPAGIGEYCETNAGCAAGRRCDNGDGTQGTRLCIPDNGEGQGGDYCSHDHHCASIDCIGAPGRGVCSAVDNNGAWCDEDRDCDSGRCDIGWFTTNTRRCIPNDGTGRGDDYCTHNNHCRPPLLCERRRGAVAGTCD